MRYTGPLYYLLNLYLYKTLLGDRMNDLSVSEKLAFSTTRIVCDENNDSATGTGFFFNFSKEESDVFLPAIVTNKHVVNNSQRGKFQLPTANEEDKPELGKYSTVEVEDFSNKWINHPNPSIDLCILPLLPILESKGLRQKASPVYLDPSLIPSKEQSDELTAIEDIIMIGYPNGIWDPANNQPLIRKGITATHPNMDYKNNKEFMIDAACFPGSSGSPVIILNRGSYSDKSGGITLGTRILLLGILYAGPQHITTGEIKIQKVPVKEKAFAVSKIPNNLGNVIKSSELLKFEEVTSINITS